MNIVSEKSWMTGPPKRINASVASKQVLAGEDRTRELRFRLRLITS